MPAPFTAHAWKNKTEAETTPLDRQELNIAEVAQAAYAVLVAKEAETAAKTDAASKATAAAAAAETAAKNSALQKAANLSDLASLSTAQTNLGLKSAAYQNTSAFDAAGVAATAQSAAEAAAVSKDTVVATAAKEEVKTEREARELSDIPLWKPFTEYHTKDQIIQNHALWVAKSDHISGASFGPDETKWTAVTVAVLSVNGATGVVSLTAANVAAVALAEKGVASGVASLDGSGKVPVGQLPPTTGAVSSVNSKIGAVVLTAADVGGSPVTEVVALVEANKTVSLPKPTEAGIVRVLVQIKDPNINLVSAVAGQSQVIEFTKEFASSTPHLVPQGGQTIRWPGGIIPPWSQGVGSEDTITLTCSVNGVWKAYPGGLDLK